MEHIDLSEPPLPAYQEQRRRKIIDAARERLKSDEYEQIQIRDVAAAAGVALGTLYRYFSSKEQLYANVLYEWSAPFANNDASWERLNDMERLTRRIERAMEGFERRPQFFKLSLMLLPGNDQTMRKLGQLRFDALDDALLQDLRSFDPLEARNITVIIWGTLMQMFMRVDSGAATMADTRSAMTTLMGIVRARFDEVQKSPTQDS